MPDPNAQVPFSAPAGRVARPRGSARRRWRRVAAVAGVALVLALGAAALTVRVRLLRSLPRLDGTVTVPVTHAGRAVPHGSTGSAAGMLPGDGLGAPVTISRDAMGVPTIVAASRLDASYALGFLHAQERFFQMDLLRRSAAGELAALFGRALVSSDRAVRVHRFRDVARRAVAGLDAEGRAHVEAYTRGVAAGLVALGAPPFEYMLLQGRPAPWRPEDSILVILTMFLELGDGDGAHESAIGLVHDTLPAPLAAFLDARGTEWDAPLDSSLVSAAPLPGPAVLDLRHAAAQRRPAPRGAPSAPVASPPGAEDFERGSNNWAVDGAHGAQGRALLAGDMHLGIGVPNTWYRVSLVTPDPALAAPRVVTGVTLPGAPAIIAGSNGEVAWAFSNSQTDAADLVVLEMIDKRAGVYRMPAGEAAFAPHVERIEVHGGADDTLLVQTTAWGPVIDHDFALRPRALHWTAHDPAAIDYRILGMERVRTVQEALALAPNCGIPPQNCVVADRAGHIGWTIMGRLPRRVGFDGQRPVSWADGTCHWDGYLTPEEMPRWIDPPAGRIWTANNRVVGGDAAARLGDSGWALGARAGQIRDALLALDAAQPADLLRIQLDDRALFLQRWRDLLLTALTPQAVAADPRRAAAKQLVEAWGGRAAVESAGYRIVRRFRDTLVDDVCMALAAPCKRADPRFVSYELTQREGPVWQLLTARPAHLLDARYPNWEAQILAAVDTTLGRLAPVPPAATAAARERAAALLATRTWGERNTTRIQHPLSRAVPLLGRWLDMPRRALPGDSNMPRVQSPAGGASQRMVVSPGHEADGIFHMPCGQSGHPLSPHYRDGHAAWEQGLPTPFLPGPERHRLQLVPAAGAPGSMALPAPVAAPTPAPSSAGR